VKILWFVVDLIATNEDVTSSFASTRRRCLEVLRGFGRAGVQADIELVRVNQELKLDAGVFENASLAIVGKMIFDFSDIASHLKKNNIPIICDGVDLYDDETVRQKAIGWADYLTFSTHSFYRPLPEAAEKPCFSIPDIQEGTVQPVSVPGVEVEVIKLMWYGSEVEWGSLLETVQQLKELQEFSIELLILGSAVPAEALTGLNNELPKNVVIEHLPWRYALYTERLSGIDFVLLPYPPAEAVGELVGDPIVSALWHGKMILACSAWTEHHLHDFIGTTDDVTDGVRVFMTRLNSVANLIMKGQAFIEENNSLKVGTLKWIEVIEEVTQESLLGEDPALQSESTPGVKLKMGAVNRSGDDSALTDYVHIGDKDSDGADVVCDLKTLSKFQTDTADEILSVDNIDQFYQWEVGDVLKSWARVLKPGGALVIECADFSMACEQFLKESVAGNTANTLKLIYGDPAQRNPCEHPKWGYTSESLKRLMLACGLEGVELQTRSGMDHSNSDNRIRMVGIKPTV